MNLGLVESEFVGVTNRHHARKINKWALKLIGLANIDLSHEDLLEFISLHVHPSAIQALVYDSFNDFYTLFLSNIESFCQLVGRKASTLSYTIRFLPLLDFYVVDNVYPSTTNDDLCDTFGNFGHVFQVTNYHILPNSSKFSHILSGKREISFTLPGEKTELCIPINVFHHPYRYHVKKLCSACMTEGHSVLNCPDIEDDVKSEPSEDVDIASDNEIDCILKTENISLFNAGNVSCVEFKEEVTKNDASCDLENNTPPITITSVEERALVPLSNETLELDLHSPEFCTGPLQLCDKSPLVSEEVIEHDLQSTEFLTGPIQLSDKLLPVPEKVIEHDHPHSSEFSTGPLQLSNKSLPVPEKSVSKSCFKTSNPENTNTTVTCNSTSNFFNALVRKRKEKSLSSGFTVENSMEIEESSDVNIKKKKQYTKRISDCADISTTEVRENSNPSPTPPKEPRKVSWQLSPEDEECINNSIGILPPQVLKDVILSDGRNTSLILNILFMHSKNFKEVDRQFKRLYHQYKKSSVFRSNPCHMLSKITSIRRLVSRFR